MNFDQESISAKKKIFFGGEGGGGGGWEGGGVGGRRGVVGPCVETKTVCQSVK